MNEKLQYQLAIKRLEQIFDDIPADCTELRIGARVWFAGTATSEMYFLTDYLYVGNGRTRVRFTDRDDQLKFTPTQIDIVSGERGWAMGQPSRRNTTEFLYTFRPDEGQHRFSLNSKSAQYAERRHQERVFSQYALTA